jgi:hypothetical protein
MAAFMKKTNIGAGPLIVILTDVRHELNQNQNIIF